MKVRQEAVQGISRRVVPVSDYLRDLLIPEKDSIRRVIGTLPAGSKLIITVQAILPAEDVEVESVR